MLRLTVFSFDNHIVMTHVILCYMKLFFSWERSVFETEEMNLYIKLDLYHKSILYPFTYLFMATTLRCVLQALI